MSGLEWGGNAPFHNVMEDIYCRAANVLDFSRIHGIFEPKFNKKIQFGGDLDLKKSVI